MTNSRHVYGQNCHEYAQIALDNKPLAVSTRHEWQRLINRLPLDQYSYPPKEIDIWNMVNTKYPNQRTKRGVLLTLNTLLGIKMATGKPSSPIFDLPDFDELDAYIHTPKNKYQARCRMYHKLMLHAGLRIGETMYRHQIEKIVCMRANRRSVGISYSAPPSMSMQVFSCI